uniref:Uncharacterized protein n=1 Tax=Cyprinus carpio TaxID=7962 RepID=A0A8C1ZQ81_CYPCA
MPLHFCLSVFYINRQTLKIKSEVHVDISYVLKHFKKSISSVLPSFFNFQIGDSFIPSFSSWQESSCFYMFAVV